MSGKQINSYNQYSTEINGNTFTQRGNGDFTLEDRIAQLESDGIDWSLNDEGDLVVNTDDIYAALDRRHAGVVDAD